MYGSVSALSESLVLMELANVTPVCAGVSRLKSGADGGGADARPQLSKSVIAMRAPIARIHTLGIGGRENYRSHQEPDIVESMFAPSSVVLSEQSLPAEPQLDPPFFTTGPFIPGLQSSAIITLLKADSVNDRIFVGEAVSNTLRIFDFNRHLKSTLRLGSAPTDVISDKDRILVLESGNLAPNDEPSGSLVAYQLAGDGSLRRPVTVIDSLFRPVFVERYDFDGDGRPEYVICEFGNNRGRLALYRAGATGGSRYQRQVLDASPGAIRFEIRDMTGDGTPDIVALFAQADERIVLFENDGAGRFGGRQRVLARFPPVYGSMYFTLADFNGDGKPDIVYVNGDNFDYSRVLKPYHGLRLLENDGQYNF